MVWLLQLATNKEMSTEMSAFDAQKGAKILVLQPDRDCGPDRLAGWSASRGIELDVRNADTPAEMPASVQGFDGLIVLGGDMGDGDTDDFPWLEKLRERLREAHEIGLPTLGICLGAQLLASALGGEVRRGENGLETGVVKLLPLDEAEGDDLLVGLTEAFYSGAMHQDAITQLPAGSVLLATGDDYPNQIFRCGSTWGVQFHPEVGPTGYASWEPTDYASDPDVRVEFDATVEEFKRLDSIVEKSSEKLIGNFLGVVEAGRANGGNLVWSAGTPTTDK
jgi:GMP synthase (glutamine-hydrolysing)